MIPARYKVSETRKGNAFHVILCGQCYNTDNKIQQRFIREEIRHCYGLNVCILPKFVSEISIPWYDGIRRWGLWDVNKVS